MKYRGMELHGKTAGIIGMGHIGTAIAQRCEGLGMKVTYWSKKTTSSKYKLVKLEDLFSTSDVIFPTMAVNENTKKLITKSLLKSMKSSAILISVVHELFDEKLVLDMVKRGKLFGFGFESAPGSFNTFVGNVWAAPAYAWVTDGSMNNSMTKWVENMIDAAKRRFLNRVN